ncbi:green-sensitive opsin-1-like [Eurytemora carolleeae]|uniref:green-sensitive opsin-1-like n=1 Tax=Eurytemora carolleeae TaxID=1294199 RepID=UPI000C76449B|nr:green-sensitive opsin-1-like [Eurytemora carolleeae]|eukprot:XP_023330892.1 green-sensitive opsin-1-like [Eurytemora affinis]
MIVVMILVFICCWGPYASLSFLGILGYSEEIPVLYTVFPLHLCKSSILWNLLVYIILNPTFNSEIRKLIWFLPKPDESPINLVTITQINK